MDELRNRLQDVFRDIFDDDGLALADDMTPDDIDGWDSMMHINLVIAIEKEFSIKLTTTEMSSQQGEFANIDAVLQLISSKTN